MCERPQRGLQTMDRREQDYRSVNRGGQILCFRKTAHPRNAEEPQNYERTEVSDTLNIFDNTEKRTPTLILENHPADSRVKISEDGMVQTLSSRMGTGGGNVPIVLESNQNHATAKETEVCPSLPASMGLGGGLCADDSHAT